jgi:GH24 family phage-related lysozyme (muramidase)
MNCRTTEADMKTSDKGVALIKSHEGLRLNAYLCPANVWTIGYGHTSGAGAPTVVKGMKITREEADAILRRDLGTFERGVSRRVKVGLSQSQFDALVSFAFNVGLGAFERSTLLRKLNAGRYGDVPGELMKWTKGGGRELPGLVNRRRDEAGLWRSVDIGATGGRGDVGEVDTPAPPKSMVASKTGNAAIIAGLTGSLAPINEAMKAARETADGVSGLAAAGPWVLLAVVIVGAVAFIWFDRRKKLTEEGV